MFVIDDKQNVSLINYKIVCDLTRTFFFVIYHKCFCYYSVVWQKFQWLIEEKDVCWVVDRAVLFVARWGQFESGYV